MGKKVGVYVRVSTEKQEADNQRHDIEIYCQSMGYHIYEYYTDIISGKANSRPSFDKLFQDAHEKKFDIVIFWAIDRFSRSGTLYTLQKLKELENLGIDWHSLKEPYFSTLGQFKDVVLSIMATLAKMERERISERTKAGLRKAKNVGKRGKDKKPRRRRSDRGIKRGAYKN